MRKDHGRLSTTVLRLILRGWLVLGMVAPPLGAQQAARTARPPWMVPKQGVELDIRSEGWMLRERLRTSGTLTPPSQEQGVSARPELGLAPPPAVPEGNIQVNDGHLDHVLTLPGSAPLVLYTQSETALAVDDRHLVAAYNTSVFQTASTLFVSGVSTSTDGGRTWTSGFLPPVQGAIATFGDPSVAVDRQGTFYATGLGVDATFTNGTIQMNRSTDGGMTWSDAVIVEADSSFSGDKPWMTVGPDPVRRDHDNVYVTWTSFQPTGTQLRFGRSRDGGATWRTQILPVSDPPLPESLSYSVPFVDASTGILYIPYLHFGPESLQEDFIRILISADGGDTFTFATFHAPGAPDPTLLPIVPAGDLTDCGTFGGFRLTIHAGRDVGGGRPDTHGHPLPRFVQAARLIHQPAFAARHGTLYLAWLQANSTGGSDILFVQSPDGGAHWTRPVQVNPPVAQDVQHVLPTLAVEEDPRARRPLIAISYYTQHRDETVDVETASSRDGGRSFSARRVTSTSFALAPTNIPLPTPQDPFNTVNFDNTFAPCYNLGEYMSAKVVDGRNSVLWSDSRHLVTEPDSPLDPLSGQTHPQQDIFFQARVPDDAEP